MVLPFQLRRMSQANSLAAAMPKKVIMDDLKKKLQERQHKLTPQRQTVLQVFVDHPGKHLSAEDVHGVDVCQTV